VRTAIMPQPRSTPTAEGTMAPLVAMTLPMVALLPACTSGMTATWQNTKGRHSRRLDSIWMLMSRMAHTGAT
jgi:hypothetical protein